MWSTATCHLAAAWVRKPAGAELMEPAMWRKFRKLSTEAARRTTRLKGYIIYSGGCPIFLRDCLCTCKTCADDYKGVSLWIFHGVYDDDWPQQHFPAFSVCISFGKILSDVLIIRWETKCCFHLEKNICYYAIFTTYIVTQQKFQFCYPSIYRYSFPWNVAYPFTRKLPFL